MARSNMNNVCKNSHKNDTANIQSLKHGRKQVEKKHKCIFTNE